MLVGRADRGGFCVLVDRVPFRSRVLCRQRVALMGTRGACFGSGRACFASRTTHVFRAVLVRCAP